MCRKVVIVVQLGSGTGGVPQTGGAERPAVHRNRSYPQCLVGRARLDFALREVGEGGDELVRHFKVPVQASEVRERCSGSSARNLDDALSRRQPHDRANPLSVSLREFLIVHASYRTGVARLSGGSGERGLCDSIERWSAASSAYCPLSHRPSHLATLCQAGSIVLRTGEVARGQPRMSEPATTIDSSQTVARLEAT